MYITIIGAGYVGLVSGACFSEFGVDVTCVDLDVEKIARLNKGESPIYEPGLHRLLIRNNQAGRLHFSADLAESVPRSEVVFIAVGTPERRGDGAADLQYVFEAARQVAANLKNFTVVVTKSTVPVGTGTRVAEIIRQENPEADFAMASNPEFLREGAAIEDFMRPNRVVIGVDDPRAENALRSLYRPLYLIETPILITDIVTAELTKYAANAFLATKITFIKSLTFARRLAPTFMALPRGWGWISGWGESFCTPARVTAAPAFPRTPKP